MTVKITSTNEAVGIHTVNECTPNKPFSGCDYCGKEPKGAEFYWRYDHQSESWKAACTVCYPSSDTKKRGSLQSQRGEK